MINFYEDNVIPLDPYFGLFGLDLRERVLPALCGPFGRILPENQGDDDADTAR